MRLIRYWGWPSSHTIRHLLSLRGWGGRGDGGGDLLFYSPGDLERGNDELNIQKPSCYRRNPPKRCLESLDWFGWLFCHQMCLTASDSPFATFLRSLKSRNFCEAAKNSLEYITDIRFQPTFAQLEAKCWVSLTEMTNFSFLCCGTYRDIKILTDALVVSKVTMIKRTIRSTEKSSCHAYRSN